MIVLFFDWSNSDKTSRHTYLVLDNTAQWSFKPESVKRIIPEHQSLHPYLEVARTTRVNEDTYVAELLQGSHIIKIGHMPNLESAQAMCELYLKGFKVKPELIVEAIENKAVYILLNEVDGEDIYTYGYSRGANNIAHIFDKAKAIIEEDKLRKQEQEQE